MLSTRICFKRKRPDHDAIASVRRAIPPMDNNIDLGMLALDVENILAGAIVKSISPVGW